MSAVVLLLLATCALLVSTVLIANAYERERLKAEEALAESNRAEQNFKRAEQQRVRAEQQRVRAEKSFRQAREAVEFFTKVSEKELAYHPFLQSTRRRMLLVALDHFQEFIEDRGDDPGLQQELAVSRAHVRKLLTELSTLHSGRFQLLTEAAVQHDLQLSEEQRLQVKEFNKKQLEQLVQKGFKHKDPWTKPDRLFGDWARANEQVVTQILTKPQTQRLNQILLQVQLRGPHAFTDLSVVETLGLSAAQKEKLRAQQDVGHSTVNSLFQQGLPPDKFNRTAEALWQKIHEKILAGLRAEQRQRWQGMVGEPFRGVLRQPAVVFGGSFPGMGGPKDKGGFKERGGFKDRGKEPPPGEKGPPF